VQTESQLSLKLLAKFHLSVPERRSLPAGRVRASVLASAVQEVLDQNGWFPFSLKPGRDLGEGAVIESRGEELWVHEQHEVGVTRFGPIWSFRVPDLHSAIKAYVSANGGSPIDGVEIDWRA